MPGEQGPRCTGQWDASTGLEIVLGLIEVCTAPSSSLRAVVSSCPGTEFSYKFERGHLELTPELTLKG